MTDHDGRPTFAVEDRDEGVSRRRGLTILVFVGAAIGYLLTYRLLNDHFDRLARARQIAVFGEVPFRDFFDPGYFLTLYISALLQRLFGDNLLGELLLNVLAMAAGTTVVYVLATRVSRSTLWGLLAAALIVAGQPRAYDYDKVLFYPLGLYACWRYIDRPTRGSLWIVAVVTAIATLFRYDSGVYLGAAALVAIVARHWGDWSVAGRRVARLALIALTCLAPALLFIQATAGLTDAVRQVTTYAMREGARSALFRPLRFKLDLAATSEAAFGWVDYLTRNNAAAWMYGLALILPVAVLGLVSIGQTPRIRTTIARLACFVTLAELVTIFVLREPVRARIGGVMPLIAVGLSYAVGEWSHWVRQFLSSASAGVRARYALLASGGLLVALLTVSSVGRLVELPPKANLDVLAVLANFAKVPTSLDLWPISSFRPLVSYLRDCTQPDDRVLVGWFGGEVYFFSGRGFAAGLPVVFGEHWAETRYQRRSLALLERQSVPIILTIHSDNLALYGYLWDFITKHYERVDTTDKDGFSDVEIWTRREIPVVRRYGASSLPCYAN